MYDIPLNDGEKQDTIITQFQLMNLVGNQI